MDERLLEVHVSGEPPAKGDALDWVMAMMSELTPEQEKRVRERVRTIYRRRMNPVRHVNLPQDFRPSSKGEEHW